MKMLKNRSEYFIDNLNEENENLQLLAQINSNKFGAEISLRF